MCSQLCVPVKRQATAFWINLKHESKSWLTTTKSILQWSCRVKINACTPLSKSLNGKKELSVDKSLGWKKIGLITEFIYSVYAHYCTQIFSVGFMRNAGPHEGHHRHSQIQVSGLQFYSH